jgi:class 3 adenylate cyclase/tetratricopeptide (TPR) repeat protein
MRTCPTCGHGNTDDARFCSQCATSLAEAPTTREERKVVTCLFCDLVGFTARAEAMDPEDVRRVLQPYHARVRSELERFGGTVEKFIGDAVMAVFGAPVAHEDDPERAVRAALSIRDLLTEDGELEIRIGITTGEALVALGARPEVGEGIASGDVVNTAARLQTAAPTNGILVDETTFRATDRAIEYGEPESVDAKGKSVPIPVWSAQTARARVAVERVGGATLVGREQELTLLRETLARVVREREPQLVTLVGVPGIGKSRLVYELFQTIETGEHGLVFWRHGRSLPYGEGVTFWALGEMVKAQAGILESESSEQAGEKLRQAVLRFVPDDADAAWLERRLRPLVGLEAAEVSGDRRGESFAAWRRFLEAIAEERPLVLVFEDLHWADDALLDFVRYLVDWATGVPLLVVSTARPELLSRRPDWGGGTVNSATTLLSPLSDEETAALVHELLGRSAIEADLQARLLEHAGGNPLYAEEFTRMLIERPTEEAVVPESVQGMIAARLDTLPVEEKALLQDAAVMGRTFWLGALGRERGALEERLHSLVRKEFVTRNRRSSVAGEDEYVFRHALMRDVAYEQIPRAERAARHESAAEWIESLGRTEDQAEMLAYHYTAALDAARASGQPVEPFAEGGRRALREAGDRAFALNAFPAAARYYELATELWPEDDPERPELVLQLGRAYHVSGDERRERWLEEAREALLAANRVELAAEADALLAEAAWYRRDRERCDRLLARATDEVARLPDSPAKALVLSQAARYRMLADEFEDAIRIGQEALAMAERLGLDELRAHALDTLGTTRVNLGDEDGVSDIERAVDLALAIRSPEAARALNNLGSAWASLGDFQRQGEYLAEAVRVGEELGALSIARYARAFLASNFFWTGRWDEGLALAEAWLADSGRESSSGEIGVRRNRAWIRLARDDVAGTLEDMDRAVADARTMREPQALFPALGAAARVYVELGRDEEARALGAELLEQLRLSAEWRVLDFSFVADELGYGDEFRELLERLPDTPLNAAGLALAAGEFGRAAEVLDEGGVTVAAADARRASAQRLARAGRHAEAAVELEQALRFYREVRATRFIRECESLLEEVSEVSA